GALGVRCEIGILIQQQRREPSHLRRREAGSRADGPERASRAATLDPAGIRSTRRHQVWTYLRASRSTAAVRLNVVPKAIGSADDDDSVGIGGGRPSFYLRPLPARALFQPPPPAPSPIPHPGFAAPSPSPPAPP